MKKISSSEFNGIVWPIFFILLILYSFIAYRKGNKVTFISANGTQSGIPLAFNFIAASIGCSLFIVYPNVANIAGIMGLVVYALTSAIPLLVFAYFGPLIKKRCPEGFLLTEWVYQRFGRVAGMYLAVCSLFTLFLFMVSEVSSLNQAVYMLTGHSGLPVVIVECIVITIYTVIGGLNITFISSNLQILAFMILIFASTIAVGRSIELDPIIIHETSSELLHPKLLAWKLIYIFTVAILTCDFFISGFWLRVFAARTNADLWIGSIIAFFAIIIIIMLVGITGILSVWAGYAPVASVEPTFYIMMNNMSSEIIGLVLALILILCTCTLNTLHSATISTISSALFRDRFSIRYMQVLVALVMIPVVVAGLAITDILNIFLIVDLISAAIVPVMMLGLVPALKNFVTVWELVLGSIGGFFCVFIFGTIYYDSAYEGLRLLMILQGLYIDDWGVFGALVAAPVGSILVAAVVLAVRYTIFYLHCHLCQKPFKTTKSTL